MANPTTLAYPAATPSSQLFGGGTATGVATLAITTGTRDPGSQAECQLADGSSAGFTDTTYTLTAGQLGEASRAGA